MRRMMTAIGLGLSAVLLTSGCQLVGGGGNNAKSSKPAQTTKSAGGQQAQAAPSPQSSAGVPPVSKQVTLPIPGKRGQTFTLGFASLKVKGQLATLTLTWTPHGIGEGEDPNGDSIYAMNGGSGNVGNISMIDTANLKRYVTVHDSDDNDLSSDVVNTEAANDQSVAATYTFAAPPANASIDIYLDSRPVFESVQVTR